MIGYLRVPREVVRTVGGWSVTLSEFVTADPALAEAVRDRLDAIDPVQGPPCLHTGDRVETRRLCDPAPTFLCMTCGSSLDAEGRPA